MSFLGNCRRIINGSSLRINNNSQIRSKHSISRATQIVSKEKPLRQFVAGKGKSAGRNSKGRITIFHRGGGVKRSQRTIDLKRNTSSIGIVERIEYDPNRKSRIALVRWEGEGKRKDDDLFHKESQIDHCMMFPPFFDTQPDVVKGHFSLSSIPGMIESSKAVSSRPKTRHVVVGLSNGVSPYSIKSKDEETRTTNVRDVFLTAFKASDAWLDRIPFKFYTELCVPRMALAGSRPDFFATKYIDAVPQSKRLVPTGVKNWRKDSPVWDHKMRRKAAISWQSVRQQDIGLDFVGAAGKKDSRLKAIDKADHKHERLNRKFTSDRAPLTYILAPNRMKAGQMVMNIDSSKHSMDKILKRY